MTQQAIAPYPERLVRLPRGFDLAAASAWGGLEAHWPALSGAGRFARQVEAEAARLSGHSASALLAEATALRTGLLRDPAGLQTRAFGLVHVAVERELGLRYYPVQLAGGRALTSRRVVEMATGEGKTITAALPAAAAALAGRPVHVVTVNDYLAARDAARLRPVFAALGLTVGLVKGGDEPEARRAAYAANIAYVSNKELTFDYLKDRIATRAARGGARRAVAALAGAAGNRLVLRGLHVAIVDEADSVLIDEARTPLIISAERPDATAEELAGRALDLARTLRDGEHWTLDAADRVVRLTEAGRATAAERSAGLPGLFRARHAREALLAQALSALHLFARDRHYIVADGAVQIVDEYTGRVMPDRSWEQGLHQLIEAKEGVALTGARETLARITYQRFFNRYLHLSGMTGTAREVAGELRAVYGLRTVRLPTHRPVQRRTGGGTLLPDATAKWEEVAVRAETVARMGRPVLVGTQSVEASEVLSAVLARRGVEHVVLNARQDRAEAEVVARAGEAGRVTVATNMAGRGTDIVLGPGVAEKGGLHVILTGFHDSRRIDRQLVGRAARQGDPGSFECVVAADDDLFTRFAPGARGTLGMLRRRAQRAASRANAEQRRLQMAEDERLERGMGFAGTE